MEMALPFYHSITLRTQPPRSYTSSIHTTSPHQHPDDSNKPIRLILCSNKTFHKPPNFIHCTSHPISFTSGRSTNWQVSSNWTHSNPIGPNWTQLDPLNDSSSPSPPPPSPHAPLRIRIVGPIRRQELHRDRIRLWHSLHLYLGVRVRIQRLQLDHQHLRSQSHAVLHQHEPERRHGSSVYRTGGPEYEWFNRMCSKSNDFPTLFVRHHDLSNKHFHDVTDV